jgi:hypothetical protein
MEVIWLAALILGSGFAIASGQGPDPSFSSALAARRLSRCTFRPADPGTGHPSELA